MALVTNYTLYDSYYLNQSISFPSLQFYNTCISFPPKIVSDGIWHSDKDDVSTLRYSFTILQLQIITIFAITQFFHLILKRLGCPYFFSSVMAGFVLGPTLKMGALDEYKQMLFPFGSNEALSLISSFGFTFYMFLNYIQMDFSTIIRLGKKAWIIALSTTLIPIALGFMSIKIKTMQPFWFKTIGEIEFKSLPVVIISHSGCNFPVVATLLNDLKILNSELGRLALASALVSDLSSNIMTGIGTAIVSATEMKVAYKNFGMLIFMLIFIPLITRPAMRWVVRRTPQGRPVDKIYIHIITLMVLLLGLLLWKICNQPLFAGAVVFGLSVPEGPPLGTQLIQHLDLFSTWFLLPIFLTTSTMKVDLTLCKDPWLLFCLGIVIVVVHLVKMLIGLGVCKLCKMPNIDGICMGLILGCKGSVEIAFYTLLYEAQKCSANTAGAMLVSVLVIGVISKIGVKALYDPKRKYAGYQKRNIMYMKSNAELRIVACIHKPCHITPTKNFLELCSPTPNNTLVVDVVHLLELIGRSSPIFISHKHQQIVSSTLNNYSGELIVTFNLFEHDYAGVATINTYTAVSPVTLMHEDVCHLAMDKIASLIILPFHLKWGHDGKVESEDKNIRSLNTKITETAPCSIGILVNRGGFCTFDPANIAVVFLGGADDREALCLAKRLVKESGNKLCVFRLVDKECQESQDTKSWDQMLDSEVLRDIHGTIRSRVDSNVTYEEIITEDATQTASFLNQMANKFDYIIVGRRNGVKSPQTDALLTWTEFPELGVVGDLLASPDMETKASILVVQQQQVHK